MTTVNYDTAVPYYDATRGFRPDVSRRYRNAILQLTSTEPAARFLELGIGTGLIGLPFIAAGTNYVGVDFSRGMLRQIAPKLDDQPQPALAQVDITEALPFAADSFDLVQAVRVFHLLGDWRRCISESRRVLKPNGTLVIVEIRTPNDAASPPPWSVVQDKWHQILRDLGVNSETMLHGNGLTEAQTAEYICAIGGEAEVIDLLTFAELPVSCRTMVDRRAQRMFSNDWTLPDDLHREAARRLYHWLNAECEGADEMTERRMVFRAVVARF